MSSISDDWEAVAFEHEDEDLAEESSAAVTSQLLMAPAPEHEPCPPLNGEAAAAVDGLNQSILRSILPDIHLCERCNEDSEQARGTVGEGDAELEAAVDDISASGDNLLPGAFLASIPPTAEAAAELEAEGSTPMDDPHNPNPRHSWTADQPAIPHLPSLDHLQPPQPPHEHLAQAHLLLLQNPASASAPRQDVIHNQPKDAPTEPAPAAHVDAPFQSEPKDAPTEPAPAAHVDAPFQSEPKDAPTEPAPGWGPAALVDAPFQSEPKDTPTEPAPAALVDAPFHSEPKDAPRQPVHVMQPNAAAPNSPAPQLAVQAQTKVQHSLQPLAEAASWQTYVVVAVLVMCALQAILTPAWLMYQSVLDADLVQQRHRLDASAELLQRWYQQHQPCGGSLHTGEPQPLRSDCPAPGSFPVPEAAREFQLTADGGRSCLSAAHGLGQQLTLVQCASGRSLLERWREAKQHQLFTVNDGRIVSAKGRYCLASQSQE